jgi:hypothetical protein
MKHQIAAFLIILTGTSGLWSQARADDPQDLGRHTGNILHTTTGWNPNVMNAHFLIKYQVPGVYRMWARADAAYASYWEHMTLYTSTSQVCTVNTDGIQRTWNWCQEWNAPKDFWVWGAASNHDSFENDAGFQISVELYEHGIEILTRWDDIGNWEDRVPDGDFNDLLATIRIVLDDPTTKIEAFIDLQQGTSDPFGVLVIQRSP